MTRLPIPFGQSEGDAVDLFERRLLLLAARSGIAGSLLIGVVGLGIGHRPAFLMSACFAAFGLYALAVRRFGPPHSIRVALFAVAITFVVTLSTSVGMSLATAMVVGMIVGPLTLVGTKRQLHLFIGAITVGTLTAFWVWLPSADALTATAILAVGAAAVTGVYTTVATEFAVRDHERSAMFTGVGVGIAWLDREHRILECNGDFRRILGVDGIVGSKVASVIPYLDRPCRSTDTSTQARGTRTDGGRFTVEVSHARVSDASQDGCALFIRDISERTAAQAHSKAVLAALPDTVSVHRADGSIESLDHRKAAVIPRALAQLGIATGDPGLQSAVVSAVMRTLATRRTQRIELTSGSGVAVRYVEARFAPIPDEDLVVSVMRDITGQRTTAEALRASEARLRAMFDHSAVPTMLISNRRVVDANDAARREFGRHLAPQLRGMVGTSVDDFVHPDDLDEIDAAIARVASDGAPPERRLIRIQTTSTRQRWVDTSIATIDNDPGGGVYVVLQGIDVTAAENARARLKNLVEEKDSLIAGISHELRTPVTAIVGFLDLALSGTTDAAERDEMLSVAASQAQDLAGLIDDLLVGARVDAGRMAATVEPVHLAAEAGNIIGEAVRTGVRITQHRLEPATAMADGLRVRQILRNLLSNAAAYGGPHVEVETGTRGLSGYVVVRDDGPGIDPADRGRIFERYERSKVTETGPGLGLGLWVSRMLAGLMDGSLTYDYVDGMSAFELRLPLAIGVSEAGGDGSRILEELDMAAEPPLQALHHH